MRDKALEKGWSPWQTRKGQTSTTAVSKSQTPLALDKEGIATARLADVLDIGPRILSVALVIAATAFFLANLDAFAGVGALLALLGAAIVLGWGVLLSSAALMHRHLWKLSPTSRHDYALRLYHGRSGKNPKRSEERR